MIPKPTSRIMAAVAAVCAAAMLVYLALFDPTVMPAPQCTFHLLTGLDCPGCGSQRAIHALLHGHIGRAWHYNPALFIAIPLIILYIWQPRRLRPLLLAPATLYVLAAITIAWWIARNLVR